MNCFYFNLIAPVVFADSTDRSSASKIKPPPNNENIVYNTNVQLIQRRGSMPCESLTVLSRNGCNGKNRSSRKKLLQRRSSGGADLLVPTIGETDHRGSEMTDDDCQPSQTPSSTSWFRFKREITRNRSELDTFLSRRRGSLPVEMQGVSHSGEIDTYCNVFFYIVLIWYLLYYIGSLRH